MKSRKNIEMPRKALVVGMGVSGQAVCEGLLDRGVRVTATDLRDREQFNGTLDSLEAKGCCLRLGTHRPGDFLSVDQIIVSPGVPLNLEPLQDARGKGIEILGELEWAWRQVARPVVAVTGTNGKTTTTTLIGEILKASGKRVFVGGNIGTPLSRWLLDGAEADVLVLEVSSFQLDTASRFRPDVGVLLNVTDDHLDRYESFSAYADSKLSLFARQDGRHTAVVNGDDPVCRARAQEISSGQVLIYSRTDGPLACTTLGERMATLHIPGMAPYSINLERAALKGVHNEENILAASLASAVCGVLPSVTQEVIERFGGLPHRVEWVRAWRGIDFYDDSKGTNVGAVLKALESFDRPVLLLLGGRDKLGSYASLAEAMRAGGKGAFVFGEAAPRIQEALQQATPTRSFKDLEGAFHAAVSQAVEGDVVLLSPACSSFDQYESYARRGDHFKRLADGLC